LIIYRIYYVKCVTNIESYIFTFLLTY